MVTLHDGLDAEMTGFLDPEVHRRFDLPLERAGAGDDRPGQR